MRKITSLALLCLLLTAGCNRGAENVQGTSSPGAGGATSTPGEHGGDHNKDDRQLGKDDDEKKIEINGEQANHHDEAEVGTLTTVEVEVDDYYFEPTLLKGKANQKVTLEIRNEGENEHNFSVDQQALNQDVDLGGTASVEVTFPASGTLTFYCKFHRGQGMLGGLQAG